MLESTIQYVKEQGNRAWIYPHVLADFGMEEHVNKQDAYEREYGQPQ